MRHHQPALLEVVLWAEQRLGRRGDAGVLGKLCERGRLRRVHVLPPLRPPVLPLPRLERRNPLSQRRHRRRVEHALNNAHALGTDSGGHLRRRGDPGDVRRQRCGNWSRRRPAAEQPHRGYDDDGGSC